MNDTSDLDDLSREVDALLAQRAAAKRAKRARDPLDDIFDEAMREPVKPQIWRPVAGVCLIHVQPCSTCGSEHSIFVGWFTERLHATDRTARDLIAGRPVGLPCRVERHSLAATDWCPACAESQLAIEGVFGRREG